MGNLASLFGGSSRCLKKKMGGKKLEAISMIASNRQGQ